LFQYLKNIFTLLGENRRRLPYLFILFLALSFLDLAGIGLIGPYVTLVIQENAMNGSIGEIVKILGLPNERNMLLILLGAILFAIFLLKAIIGVFINYTIIRFCQNLMAELRVFLLSSYQQLPYINFIHRNSSEYVYNIQHLTDVFSGGVVMSVLRMLSEGLVVIVILIFLAWTNLYAFLLLTVLVGSVMFCYDKFFRIKLQLYGNKSNNAATKMLEGVNESIDGFKETRILGKENYFLKKVKQEANEYAKQTINAAAISTVPRYMLEVMMIGFVVLMVIGGLLYGNSLNTLLPTLAVFAVAAIRLLPSSNLLSTSFAQLRFNRDAVLRLYQDVEEMSQSQSKKIISSEKSKNHFQSIKLENVSYLYPGLNIKSLNNISLEITAGESIGIIGPSGSGKTTLVDILLGLIEPQEGKCFYNQSLLSSSLEKWRSQIAYLPQQIFLIDASLKNNVALGVKEEEIDQARIDKSIRQARLQELVEQMPHGVNSVLGERGVRLSGGQRQRVAIARAFYHRRKVLVMDESTSSLDNETEREIVNEISQLKGKITLIVIAHRLSTLGHCDRIYRIEKGVITDSGAPEKFL
jgi:ATP-binding cassette, subfamily B, bacterial PglK